MIGYQTEPKTYLKLLQLEGIESPPTQGLPSMLRMLIWQERKQLTI